MVVAGTGGGGNGEFFLTGIELHFCKMNCSGDLFHNNEKSNTTKLYTENGQDSKFYIIYFLL